MNYFIKTYLKSVEKSLVEHTTFLNTLSLPILNESARLLCKGAFTEKELHDQYGPRKNYLETTDWAKNSIVAFGKN